jgi:hypothetical protein
MAVLLYVALAAVYVCYLRVLWRAGSAPPDEPRRWQREPGVPVGRATLTIPGAQREAERSRMMLLVEMIALGLVTFAAMLGFIRFCEWV